MWDKFLSSIFRIFKKKINQDVVDFLIDVDIALGNDYDQPGRDLFPQFSPYFNDDPYLSLPLSKRLAQAYKSLEGPDKHDLLKIIYMALDRCAKSPLGIRRTLTCLDLAHEIEPALVTEEVFSDLMFRSENQEELAILLLQLVHRWEKWHIKVKFCPDYWERAIKSIEPSGVFTLLLYFFDNNAIEQMKCFKKLCSIAFRRIDVEKDRFLDIGQEPEILIKQIEKLKIKLRLRDIEQNKNLNPSDKEGIIHLLNNLSPAG